MQANGFVVDRALGAVPVARLLEVRAQLRVEGTIDKVPLLPGDRPVLTGEQSLQPDTLYPAEKNPSVRYYLPKYRVSVDANGRPAVELRNTAGPGGEIGRLTITLTWTPMQADRLDVRAIEGLIVPTLRYRIPVQAKDGTTSAGGWERTTPLQPLQPSGALLVQSVTIFSDKGLFDSVYQALSKSTQGATLDLQIRARVGMKTWRQVVVGPPILVLQQSAVNSGVLFTEMIHAETMGGIRAVPASGVADVAIKAAPTEMTTRVDVARMAMAAPMAVAPPPADAVPLQTMAVAASPAMTRKVAIGTSAPTARMAATPAMSGIRFAADAPAAARLEPRTQVVLPAKTPVKVAVQPQIKLQQRPASDVVLSRVNTPSLKLAVQESDLKVAGRKAVPVNVALDRTKQPAIVDADLDNQQTLAFYFNPGDEVNRGVYVGGYSGGLHLLMPMTLIRDGRATVDVYRDSLMPNMLYLQPSGFRLERDEMSPFLPGLSFLPSDFSTTDDDAKATVLYRMLILYRLEPWFDPEIVELAKAELAKESLVAQITVSTTQDAKLTLKLDLLGEGKARTAATVDTLTGITDTLNLDHQTFLQFWSLLMAGAVQGTVEYQLFDNTVETVPVDLSLTLPSAELFDVAFVGPVENQPGRYRVNVRNRIESPARIVKLPPELLQGGAAAVAAYAVEPEKVIGQLLKPNEMRAIEYQGPVAGPVVLDFTPTVIGRPEIDVRELLKKLMVSPGYKSLAFPVTVRAAQGVFTAPMTPPLTGLLVEFDDGTKVTLTAAQDRAEVNIVPRIISQIVDPADESQEFLYRVTNLHGEEEKGARSEYLEGHGPSSIEVGIAGARIE